MNCFPLCLANDICPALKAIMQHKKSLRARSCKLLLAYVVMKAKTENSSGFIWILSHFVGRKGWSVHAENISDTPRISYEIMRENDFHVWLETETKVPAWKMPHVQVRCAFDLLPIVKPGIVPEWRALSFSLAIVLPHHTEDGVMKHTVLSAHLERRLM